MNTLIVSTFNVKSISRSIMLDQLACEIENQKGSDRVFYLNCLNTFDACYHNFESDPGICFLCKANAKKSLTRVEGDYTALSFGDVIETQDNTTAKAFFNKFSDIDFDTKFENLEIGEALLSVYISKTRNRDLTKANQSEYIKQAKLNTLVLFLALKRFLVVNNIDQVKSFNGRQDYNRAVLRAAEAVGVDCYNYERTRPGGYLEIYKNVLPHNIVARTEWIEKAWADEPSFDVKLSVGTDFFTSKRKGKAVVDKSYNQNQQKGLVPVEIDEGAKTIVLFNSSDDEFAAVGPEYYNPFFKDQLEGIHYVAELFGHLGSKYQLIIRVHPNLKGVKEEYATGLLLLDQLYPNIHVIPPESDADSYALLDIADRVIVFGSSIGIEANFWRKPVILLSKAIYGLLDVAHVPDNKDQIRELLTRPLEPKPIDGSIKYAFYAMKGGVKSKYYDQNGPYSIPLFKGQKMNDHKLTNRIIAKGISLFHKAFNVKFKL